LAKTSEFGFIAQIQEQFSSTPDFVALGIGDDAAALRPSRGTYSLLTTDTLIAGTHFSLAYSTFEQVGEKVVAVNLSDIAAMGGRPRAFLIALGVSQEMQLSDLSQLYRGIKKASRSANLTLIGGNTTRSDGPFFITLTLFGEVAKKQMLTRSGACVGDAIYVTGTVGDAAAGLDCLKQSRVRKGSTHLIRRHQMPQARTAAGARIAEAKVASAMIDVSDGLSADLGHLIMQSGVGAALELSQLPLSPALKRYAKQTQQAALDFALYGGEDYELLFSVPKRKEKKLVQLRQEGFIQATRIGTIVPKKEGMCGRDINGRIHKITPRGYDHFMNKPSA